MTWERADSLVDRQINAEQYHVWPFASTLPVDVRCLILDRRQQVPMHRPDHLEVVIFESGELGYEVEDRVCTVRKNDIIVVGDRIRHRCLPLRSAQREARSVVLSFRPALICSGAPMQDDIEYLLPFTLLNSSFPNVIPAGTGLTKEILQFIDRIRGELSAATERSPLAIRTYMKMILLLVGNYYSDLGATRDALGRQHASLRRLAPVMQRLEQNCADPIRVSDAARLCAMSSCCFMHLFKEVTGHSFVAYLNSFRVDRAKNLLASTDKAISEISLETGFCNQSYFGVIFRRITGMTPLEYRLSLDRRPATIH